MSYPSPAMLMEEVRKRVKAAGTRISVAEILEARDADRR